MELTQKCQININSNQIFRTPTKLNSHQQTAHQTQHNNNQETYNRNYTNVKLAYNNQSSNFQSQFRQQSGYIETTRNKDYHQQPIKIDYKSKTFALMKKMTQHQLYQRKQLQYILQLQKDKQNLQSTLSDILKITNTNSLLAALQYIKKLIEIQAQSVNRYHQNKIHQQLTNIICQYKKILQIQQIRSNKIQQQNKKYQIKLKKLEEQFQRKQKDNILLKKQVQSIRKQFKQVLVENNQLKQLKEEIQDKYNNEIQHFQSLEKQVQRKLKDVQKQMRYYQEEREQHLDKIQKLNKELQARKIKQYFSFGGKQTKKVQTQQWIEDKYTEINQSQNRNSKNNLNEEQNESSNYLTIQCFEASIKTLLQQNERLKKALLSIYKNKGEQLPKQTQLEIKILLSTSKNQN